jgi:queuine/archaeosine tRNA-ribosyltransferase
MVPLRPAKLTLGATALHLPVFFPSVSSVKTALPPLDYVRLLNAMSAVNRQFLVSAFDVDRTNGPDRTLLDQELARARDAGTMVLMDSGNYESFWRDSRADWPQACFHKVLREFPCHIALGFDEQDPPMDFNDHVRLIVERQERDQDVAGSTVVVPIVHGAPQALPALCREVARLSCVPMVAVPERQLGGGVFERARTIEDIQKEMDKNGRDVGLHLLGTGNPISIAVYSIAGADSFDGLEWCQTVVDCESGLLHHFSHAEFFKDQTRWGDASLPFQLRVLAHNLEFFSDWMTRLRGAMHSGAGVDFCRLSFPRRIFAQCAAALGWKA